MTETIPSSAVSRMPQEPAIFRRGQVGREMQLLLCCGGRGTNALHAERFARLHSEGLDWGLVIELGARHGMLPLLYWNLTQWDSTLAGIPTEVGDLLKQAYHQNVGRSLAMTGELFEILENLAAQSLVAVPYKGPVLSSRLYGNLGLRNCSDLDIVVKRRDLPNARIVLIDLGYSPSVMLHAANAEFQVESRYSERFDRGASIVELHWAFTNKDVAFPLTLNELEPRLDSQSVSGRAVSVFSIEDTLLILCIHGAKHGWGRLEWLCGIAELMHKEEEIDWPELLARARENRGLRRLFLGLALAEQYFQAPLPETIRDQIRREPHVPGLAAQVTSSLFGETDIANGVHTFGTIEHDLFHFWLGDQVGDSLRYLFYRMTTPSRPEQWSTVKVAGRSITLHAFTRPFGIFFKLLPALWRRYGRANRTEA